IPNLTWKKPDGTVMVNPLSFVPDNLDYAMVPSYKYVIKSVFKYFSLHNTVPYLEWLSYPTTALLTARGCTQNCSVCGGSQFAYNRVCNRTSPAYRSPKTLVEDVKLITSFSQAPIFILHDIRQAGMSYAREFFTLLKKENISNELIIELFYPADEAYFQMISECVPKFSLEVTLETHDPELRKLNGKFKCSNAEVESTIAAALKYSCRKIDIFFMSGIPKQTYASVMESMDYCQHLLETFNGDSRLALFIAPLAPFLDPGCLAYEQPEKYGYTKLCNTLEDHRKAAVQPSWKHILSYETDCMTRDQIVKSTYEAATRLNQIKFMYGLIPENVYEDIKFRITKSLETLDEIDKIMLIPDESQRKAAMDRLKEKVRDLNNATICGEDELKWPIHKRFSNTFSVAKLVTGLFLEELVWVGRKVLGLKRPEVSPFLNTTNSKPSDK
ncbi:MAG TPA: radical SAM protein, partial [Bacillota bacterium]|nr:radical SAM protein [Bacillota bacterium]